jgi:hypothetical protein
MRPVAVDPRGTPGPPEKPGASARTSWVSEEELRQLLVTRLEVIDDAEFERAQTTAARLHIPIERALADRSRVPFANDPSGAVPRLIDMGVEPFLLASTLVLVVVQRLVRRICVGCRESRPVDRGTATALRARPDFDRLIAGLRKEGLLGDSGDPLGAVRTFKGKGCPQCNGSGYRGRLAVFEIFSVDDEIRQMITGAPDGAAIRVAAIAAGMKTMFQDGLAKVLLGETTLEEVFRVAL